MRDTLFYVHDPMCSWCWAFKPTWDQLKATLSGAQAGNSGGKSSGSTPSLSIEYIVGGLAPDSDEPMPEQLRVSLQDTWQRIQQVVPGTEFNFDFWTQCEPRRSTYPACRAVLAARSLNPEMEEPMLNSIQRAYYLQARNPSDIDTLVDLATDIGLEAEPFREKLLDEETEQLLQQNISLARQLGVTGFPSLVLFINKDSPTLYNINIDYHRPRQIYHQILGALHDEQGTD